MLKCLKPRENREKKITIGLILTYSIKLFHTNLIRGDYIVCYIVHQTTPEQCLATIRVVSVHSRVFTREK